MPAQLVLSILCDDRPGIVQKIADTVASHKASWLESSLSQLAGKFAGVICIACPEEEQASLTQALTQLNTQGINVIVEATKASKASPLSSEQKRCSFSAAGPDKKGIVLEISQAFGQYGINLEELNTQCSSMPYTGDPLFEASGILSVPPNTNFDELHDRLDKIAESLGMDIHLHEE